MKLRCIAVDDEPLALDKISDYIQRVPFIELLGSFEDGLKALAFIQSNPIDLVFLDIQMPQLTGLQLVKILPAGVQVIFTTAYNEYAMEGYELNVTDYLLKPIAFDRLLLGAKKALEKLEGTAQQQTKAIIQPAAQNNYIFVKTEFRLQKVAIVDIQYIEGMKDYLMLHTVAEKIMTLQSFKSLLEKLPAEEFARIHKSYVVSLSHIDYIERNRIYIKKILLPISDTYKDAFYEQLKTRGL